MTEGGSNGVGSKIHCWTRDRSTDHRCAGRVAGATAMAGGSSAKPEAVQATLTPKATVVPAEALTGLGSVPIGPVVAVMVDDTEVGRPSMGLDKADVIYIEEAEGGLSPMVAVFASAKPQVRLVRSVRICDPQLLWAPTAGPLEVAPGAGATPCQRWTARVLVKDQLRRGNGMPDSGVVSRGLHAEDERAVSGQRHDPVMSSAQELPLPSRPPVRGLPHRKTNFMEQFQLNCVRAVAAAADCLNGDSSIDADGAEYTAVGGRPHPGGLGQW